MQSRVERSTDELQLTAESAYPSLVAGTRVRVVEMGEHLAALGVNVHFRPTTTADEYRLVSTPGITFGKAAATVRGSLRSSRLGAQAGDTLRLVHRLRSLTVSPRDRAPLDVYDFDDALYVGGRAAHHPVLGRFKLEAARSVQYMHKARLVFAGNRILADAARQYARRIEIVPSCVDPWLQQMREHQEAEVLTLGWIGSATTTQYLESILGTLASVNERVPIRLLVMGARRTLQTSWIEYRPWTIEGERQLLTEIDVGLMPLPDDPWTRGKCGFKLLRYFSAGVPSIASPVGVNTDLVADGRGLPASDDRDWLHAIETLARDVAARREIGALARAYVERSYSFRVWSPRVAALLRTLA